MDSTNDALCDCIAQLVKVNDIGMESYVLESMGAARNFSAACIGTAQTRCARWSCPASWWPHCRPSTRTLASCAASCSSAFSTSCRTCSRAARTSILARRLFVAALCVLHRHGVQVREQKPVLRAGKERRMSVKPIEIGSLSAAHARAARHSLRMRSGGAHAQGDCAQNAESV